MPQNKKSTPKIKQEKKETPPSNVPQADNAQNESLTTKVRWPSSKATIVDEFLKHEIALWANNVKTIIQMFIGVGVVFAVLIHLIYGLNSSWGLPIFQSVYDADVFAIIGYALLYSSAIELAYTLFTPGPDEAVEPLITGLAALILLGIAKINYEDLSLTDEIVRNVAVFVVVLVVFFVIRKYLLKEKS